MERGSLCRIKCKRNSLKSYVVLYPDLDEVIEARTKRNMWLPSIVSQLNVSVATKQLVELKPVKQFFAMLAEKKDCNGNLYYSCLYNDSFGWIIGNQKSFELEEEQIETNR
jgi:aminopeptidase-like protein